MLRRITNNIARQQPLKRIGNITSSVPRNNSRMLIRNMNNFSPQQPIAPKRSSLRWPLIIAAAIGVSYFGFRYYTKHNYPPEVAKKLRQGLRAEIDGGGKGAKDYNMALKYYLEALEEADKVGLYHLSDEYTGLQIKICEMYEKLGMIEEARLMYRELGTSFIQALTDGKTVSPSLRPHMIQRDLRVALKTAMYESSINPNVAKMGLLVHFVMAQKEVASKSPELAEMIKAEKNKESVNISLNLDPGSIKQEHLDAWSPFRDELFNSRDMFVALCLATGDLGLALRTKLATTEWMTTAGCEIGEILMSFYNVGSIFYLQSEELELRVVQNKDNEEEAEKSRKLAHDSMGNSSTCFNVILDAIEKLPSKMRRATDVAEVQALSTYGLGVIALHRGDYKEASNLLRESRLRAKGCEFNDLVNSAEIELEKVDKIQKDLEKGTQDVKYDPPVMDVLLVRKDKEMPEHEHEGSHDNGNEQEASSQ